MTGSRAAPSPGRSSLPDLVAAYARARALFRTGRLQKLRVIGGKLAVARAAALLGRQLNVRARLFWGPTMSVALPDPVSTSLYCYGLFDPEVTELVLAAVRDGDVVLDVGAHFGYVTLLACALVGEGGSVHAFEPTPSTFRRLERNVLQPGVPCTIRLCHAAVFDGTEPTVALRDFGTALSAFNTLGTGRLAGGVPAPARTIRVPTTTIDAYCRETSARPAVIKIDAEGAERQILAGAREVLARAKPKLLLETGDPSYVDLVRQLVDEHGYRIFVHDGECITLAHDAREAAMKKDVLLSLEDIKLPSPS